MNKVKRNNLKPKIQNPKFKTQNPKPKIQNPKLKIQNLKFAQQYGKTVERARDDHTFKDKLKEFLVYAAIFSAGLYGIKEVFKFFS